MSKPWYVFPPDPVHDVVTATHDTAGWTITARPVTTHPMTCAPCQVLDVPDQTPDGNGGWLTITDQRGKELYHLRGVLYLTLPTGVGLLVDVFPLRSVSGSASVLTPLEPRGRYFWKDNQRFFLNGASAFGAIARYYEHGEGYLRDVFKQRQDLGFNAVRLWTAINNPTIMRMIPKEHPSFYEDVVAVSHLAAEYGQYPYWTVFAGASAETLGDSDQMMAHQHRMEAALLPLGFCLLDLHNEVDNPFNAPSYFIGQDPPNSLLWSQGSNVQDVDPPEPFGRFAARHPGSSEWQRKVGKQARDGQENMNSPIPWVDDETVRVEPGGEMNTDHCYDAGACGALFIAGAFFHSREAKLCVPFRDELAQASMWCGGVEAIEKQGLDIAQEGQYSHPDDQGFLRVYVKTFNGRSITLRIRP